MPVPTRRPIPDIPLPISLGCVEHDNDPARSAAERLTLCLNGLLYAASTTHTVVDAIMHASDRPGDDIINYTWPLQYVEEELRAVHGEVERVLIEIEGGAR